MTHDQTYLMTNVQDSFCAALACAAIAKGAHILLNYPLSYPDAELKKQVSSQQLGHRLTLIPANIQDEAGVEQLFNKIQGKKIAGIIHCLSPVAAQKKSLLDMTLEDWNQMLDQTLHALFYLARQAVEEFVAESIPGRFVVLQIDHANGGEKSIEQSALETALSAFCRSVAKEYGRRDIACNTVIVSEERIRQHSQYDLAELVLFPLMKEAGYMTGEVIELR